MPIYLSDKGTVVLEFGSGDIGISVCGASSGIPVFGLAFRPEPPGDVGRCREVAKVEPTPVAAVVFNNVESLDVFASRLASVREELTRGAT